MKTHKVLFLALIVSAAFALSAHAGDRHRGNARTTGSAPAIHSSSGFRSGGNRMFAPSPRMSMRSNTFSQRQTFSGGNAPIVHRQFTPRTFTGRTGNDLAQFRNNRSIQPNRFGEMQGQNRNRTAQLGTGGGNRTIGNISPGHNHVFGQRSANWNSNWDRRRDHFWNGHRCRFVNGSWFIFDFGFFPWFGWPYYDYYPYGSPYGYGYGYGYPYGSGYGYDSGAYGGYGGSYYDGQNGYDSSNYDQGGYDSSNYDRNGNGSNDRSAVAAEVADLQDKLARAGYYHGQIDGVLGPETRHALVRYQSAKGLEPSGNLTPDTLRSLGMQQRMASGE
jgi:Putative peptidoglycan binding domain